MRNKTLSLVAGLVLSLGLAAPAVSYANEYFEAPDELPIIGLEPGAVVVFLNTVTIPPARGLTGVLYQNGVFKEYYSSLEPSDEPVKVAGGRDPKKSWCSIQVRKTTKKFNFVHAKQKLAVTKVWPNMAMLRFGSEPIAYGLSCSEAEDRGPVAATVGTLKDVFKDKVVVLIPDPAKDPKEQDAAALQE